MRSNVAPLPLPTFGAVMAAGRTTGFDYLRLGLAVAILCFHSLDVSYGARAAMEIENGPIRPLIALRLPMFFALSGFLVAGSLDRCRSLISFVGLRAIRVGPALAFQTLFVALILGPLLTNLPLTAYLQDGLLARYFLNMTGDIQYLLPGVFESNPWPHTVNAQLWTVSVEMGCYIAFAGLALFGLQRRPRMAVILVVALQAYLTAHYVSGAAAHGWSASPVAPPPALALAFAYGALLYLLRDRIPHSTWLGVISAILALVLSSHPATDYLTPLPAAYFTLWLGLMRPRPSPLTWRRDYSYGIFLFGFPIQQAVTAAMGPAFHAWWWNIALALPLTILLAAVSWHWVEKPALSLRGLLARTEDQLLARAASQRDGRGGKASPAAA